MTREQKLALIVGFALVLLVGVLVSDHLSLAQKNVAGDEAGLAEALEPETPGLGREMSALAIADQERNAQEPPVLDETYFSGPDLQAGNENRTLENRARGALSTIADGAEQAVEFLKDSQDGNLPAAQMDVLEMPSNRDAENAPTHGLSAARPSGIDRSARSYPLHTVKAGESLWSIAEHYYADGTLHARLAEFNEDRIGSNGTLGVGASIIIPPLEVIAPGKASTKRAAHRGSRDSARPAETSSGTREYTVQAGDTLSEISQRLLGTSKRWREIMDLNGLEDPAALRVGDTIKIPASE